jgi:succinoglycan biosynthesis protein ExoA
MPKVSVIVPCLNEERTIASLLGAIYAQDFARDQIEVIIADGLSTDATRQRIQEFHQAHPDLSVALIDNPTRRIPSALNLAIAAAKSEIILRLDAHCVPQTDYISRSVAALEAGRGWNVGGVWQIQPGAPNWLARSIAIAAAHPLGVGDALYRFANQAQAVDTVPFGAFRSSLIDQIGSFDEELLANEDYEFNARIRQSGGVVWLDPAIKSTYFARASLGELARQYARYGFWKVRMLRRYPGSLRPRQAIPPLFVLSLICLPLLSLISPWAATLLKLEMVIYALLLFGAAIHRAFQHRQMSLVIGIPLAIATMHISWGAAFLWSLLRPETRTQTNV